MRRKARGEVSNLVYFRVFLLSVLMKLLYTLRLVLKYSGKALAYAPLAIIAVILAEGLQHYIELSLNMYESTAAFRDNQSSPKRLSFGILKAVSVILACYFIPKALHKNIGPDPIHGSFNKDFIRKLWDIRVGTHGMIAMLIIAAPLIFLHIKLSNLAMGHVHAVTILIIDSILIGMLALTMGTSIWAGDAANAGGY